MNTITLIECGECGGNFRRSALDDMVRCTACRRDLNIAADVAPNMGHGERLTWTPGPRGFLGYTTEED